MSSYTVAKVPDKPIIVVSVVGHFNVEMARAIYAKIAEIAATLEGPIYRITDIREERTSFADIIGVIKEASKGTAGSTTDPRIKNVFVGNEKMARVARDVLRTSMGGVSMPMFGSMEHALTHIHNELAQNTGAQDG